MSDVLDTNAPAPTIAAYGAAALDTTAPFPTIEAVGVHPVGSLDATAPFPTIQAQDPRTGTLDANAPFPTIDATGSGKLTVTFNVQDDGGTALGHTALLDCFTSAEFDEGVATGFVTSNDQLSITATAVDQWSSGTSTYNYTGSYKYGYKFQPLEDITITHLSAYGKGVSQTVELWRVSDSTLLDSVTATFTADTWTFVALDSSIALDSSEEYIICAKSEGSGYYRYSSIPMADTAYVDYIEEYYTSSSTSIPTSTTSYSAMVGFRFTYIPAEATWVSPAIDVGAYADNPRTIKPLLYPSTVDVTLEWGTSDSDSVDPTTWTTHAGHNQTTDGLPGDLTGKYLYYRITSASTVEWFAVYDADEDPDAVVRVTFNGESQAVPDTGTIDFDGVDEDQTLSYSVTAMPIEVLYDEPVTDNLALVHTSLTETVTLDRSYKITGETTTVICSGDPVLFGARLNSTAPFPRIEATGTQRVGNMVGTAPFPTIEATSGQRGSMSANAPTFSLESRTGAQMDAKAPEFTITATGSGVTVGSLAKRMPTASLESRSGARASGKVPPLTIEASGSSPVLGSLTKKMPFPTIDASGSGGPGATLDKPMPFPKIEASGRVNGVGTLDAKAPTFKIAASGYAVGSGSMDAKMPFPTIDAISYTNIIRMDAKMPTPVMGLASGSDYGSGGGKGSYEDRFDDTLLRYERWA